MTLEEYRNQQHEIDLVFFHGIFKTQNAHGGRNVMPRCLSEGVDIFLKSADRQGESGHDVRVSRSAPWMARVGDPVMMRTTVSLFIRKFTPGDATSRCDVPFAAGVRGFFTNFQVKIRRVSFTAHPSYILQRCSEFSHSDSADH